MKNNKHRNSNATAAGADGGVEQDLYILSDGELESIVGGSYQIFYQLLKANYPKWHK